jgi:hypothetical protein
VTGDEQEEERTMYLGDAAVANPERTAI